MNLRQKLKINIKYVTTSSKVGAVHDIDCPYCNSYLDINDMSIDRLYGNVKCCKCNKIFKVNEYAYDYYTIINA